MAIWFPHNEQFPHVKQGVCRKNTKLRIPHVGIRPESASIEVGLPPAVGINYNNKNCAGMRNCVTTRINTGENEGDEYVTSESSYLKTQNSEFHMWAFALRVPL